MGDILHDLGSKSSPQEAADRAKACKSAGVARKWMSPREGLEHREWRTRESVRKRSRIHQIIPYVYRDILRVNEVLRRGVVNPKSTSSLRGPIVADTSCVLKGLHSAVVEPCIRDRCALQDNLSEVELASVRRSIMGRASRTRAGIRRAIVIGAVKALTRNKFGFARRGVFII